MQEDPASVWRIVVMNSDEIVSWGADNNVRKSVSVHIPRRRHRIAEVGPRLPPSAVQSGEGFNPSADPQYTNTRPSLCLSFL